MTKMIKLASFVTMPVVVCVVFGCAAILGIEELSKNTPDAAVVTDAESTPDTVIASDAQTSFVVRGTAYGLLAPVSVQLEYGDNNELLSINADGPFVFSVELQAGVSYIVKLVGEPPCVLETAAGVIEDADPSVTLVCEGVFLSELKISGPTAPELMIDPTKTTYEVDVSLLQSEASIAAVPTYAGASVTINGVAVGAASIPIALDLSENVIEVAVTGPGGGTRMYRLILRRAVEIVQAAYAKASNTDADDFFGYSLALSGDILAVGALGEGSAATGIDGDQADNSASNSGAVYVFRRVGASWAQEAYLKASNTGAEDLFGYSVALSDDTLAVGAFGEGSAATGINGDQADNFASGSGAVYVFRRSGTSWAQEAYLKASNTGAGDRFGSSLALSGNTLAIGAYLEDSAATGINGDQTDNAASNSGAVYVFRRSGASWAQEAYLKASNTGANDRFGNSMALSDDILAVGALLEGSAATGIDGDQTDNSANNSGAVYVFRRSGTSWAQEAYLKASNTDGGDQFGASVALFNNALAVGANFEDSAAIGIDGDQTDNAASLSGAVYVFRRSNASWAQEAYLKASNTGAGDEFGDRVTLSSDTLAVGAYLEGSAATGINGDQADNNAQNGGAVYVFQHAGPSWAQVAYLKASNTGIGDQFGFNSVALSGDALAVGAHLEDSATTGIDGDQDDNSAGDGGAVYVFH